MLTANFYAFIKNLNVQKCKITYKNTQSKVFIRIFDERIKFFLSFIFLFHYIYQNINLYNGSCFDAQKKIFISFYNKNNALILVQSKLKHIVSFYFIIVIIKNRKLINSFKVTIFKVYNLITIYTVRFNAIWHEHKYKSSIFKFAMTFIDIEDTMIK